MRKLRRVEYTKSGYEVLASAGVLDILGTNRKTASRLITCSYGLPLHERHRRSLRHMVPTTQYIPVPKGKRLRFLISYPLSKDYIGNIPKNMVTTWGELSVGDLCWLVAKAYKKIYGTATMKKIGEVSPKKWKAPLCWNSVCVSKNNPYGIWGHGIGDLCIEGFKFIPGDCVFEVDTGS